MDFPYLKLEIFIPESHFPLLQQSLRGVDAGHIGNYDSCLSCNTVTGFWRPLAGASPFIGSAGKVSSVTELKVEVTIRAEDLQQTIEAVKKVHPYEEPVINVIPLIAVGI